MAEEIRYCPLPEKMEAKWTRCAKWSRTGEKEGAREETKVWFRKTEPYTVKRKPKSEERGKFKPQTHTVDWEFGFEYRYYLGAVDRSREEIDEAKPDMISRTKAKRPFVNQGNPSKKNKAKGGRGERQENLMLYLPTEKGATRPKSERFCRLLLLSSGSAAIPEGHTAPLSYEEVKELDSKKQTIWTVEHANQDHNDSRLSNLKFLLRPKQNEKKPRAPKKKKERATKKTSAGPKVTIKKSKASSKKAPMARKR